MGASNARTVFHSFSSPPLGGAYGPAHTCLLALHGGAGAYTMLRAVLRPASPHNRPALFLAHSHSHPLDPSPPSTHNPCCRPHAGSMIGAPTMHGADCH